MFATIEDLGNTIYSYQVGQITEGDDSITIQALLAAESEVKGYLTANNQREHLDGRLRYDVDAIFAATGADRHPLLLTHTLTIAKWYLVELCNADMIYETAKERYDRAVSYLKKVAKGEANFSGLPLLPDTDPATQQPFRYGSRVKFNHE